MEGRQLQAIKRRDYLTIHGKQQSRGNVERLVPLKFPATRLSLWSHASTGPSSTLHLCCNRHPVLVLEEQPLRLAQRLAANHATPLFSCSLRGSLTVEPDGEGVCVALDRLETLPNGVCRPNTLEQLPHREVLVHAKVRRNSVRGEASVVQDYEQDLQLLHQRCVSKARIDLSHFVSMRASCSYNSNAQSHIFYVDAEMVVPSVSLGVTPVAPVPIVPTALSKNLSGPLSLSEMQGEPKSGYLTMDHTRKLLLVLESDPKVATLPLVGIWVSGVATVLDPVVWASGLRYLYSQVLQDRVCLPPEPFLMVLYSTLHSRPEYYECKPAGDSGKLDFSLYSCHDIIHLSKDNHERPSSPIELELNLVESGSKHDNFHAALEKCQKLLCKPGQSSSSLNDPIVGGLEEIMPRATPAPHVTKAPTLQPSVPEVTLLFDESCPASPVRPTRTKSTERPRKPKPSSSTDSPRGPLRTVNGVPTPTHAAKPPSPKVLAAPTSSVSDVSQPSSAAVVPAMSQGYYGMPGSAGCVVNGSYGNAGSPAYPAVPWPQMAYPAPYPMGPAPGYHPYMTPPFTPPGWVLPPQPRPLTRPTAQQPIQRPYLCGPTPSHGTPSLSSTRPAAVPSSLQDAYNPKMATAPVPSSQPSRGGHYLPVAGSHTVMRPHQPRPLTDTDMAHGMKAAATTPTSRSARPPPPVTSQAVHPPEASPQPVPPVSCENLPLASREPPPGAREEPPVGYEERPPAAVYALLQQQEAQLQALRDQVQQLLQKQPDESASTVQADQSSSMKQSPPHTHQGNTSQNPMLAITTQSPSHAPVGAIIVARRDAGCGSDSPLVTPQRPTPVASSKASPDHDRVPKPQLTSSPQSQGQPPATMRHSPSQDCGATLSSDNLSLADFQLTQLQDRTEESIISDMMVDMPDYGSLSPEKSPHGASSLNDTERSPVLGESVSMYQDQMVQMLPYEGEAEQESADTGLGDSHPDMALLYQNHKMFYHNLIGNVKKFLAKHDDSTATDFDSATGDDSVGPLGGSLQHAGLEQSPHNKLNHTDPLPARRASQDMAQQPLLGQGHPAQCRDSRTDQIRRSPPRHSDRACSEAHSEGECPPHCTSLDNSYGKMRHPPPPDQLQDRTPVPPPPKLAPEPVPSPHTSPERAPLPQVPSPPPPKLAPEPVMEDEPEVDIAEQTRLQLERMGIHLEPSNSVDKSAQPSLYFDPNMLPRIQYVSMLLDGDSDTSADADALAMKYLSDEQLTELVKLRQSSRRSSSAGHDAALDRLLAATSGTPNVSTYGMPANHMSFATKKYMERYGLVDEHKMPASPSRIPHAPQGDTVKDFLKTLTDRNFIGTPEHKTPRNSLTGSEFGGHSGPRETLKDMSCSTCSSCSGQREVDLAASYDGSYREYCHTPARRPSMNSDTTMYRTPDDSPGHQRHAADLSSQHKAASDHTPVRVFDKDFLKRLRNRPESPERSPAPSGDRRPLPAAQVHTNEPGKRILDIQRLKELPKLI